MKTTRPPLLIKYQGKEYTLKQLGAMCGKTRATVDAWYRRGYLEKMLPQIFREEFKKCD